MNFCAVCVNFVDYFIPGHISFDGGLKAKSNQHVEWIKWFTVHTVAEIHDLILFNGRFNSTSN